MNRKTCKKCGHFIDNAPYCSLCGTKAPSFDEKAFTKEYGESIAKMKKRQCAKNHDKLRLEFRREFPGQEPLFCDLCGAEVVSPN